MSHVFSRLFSDRLISGVMYTAQVACSKCAFVHTYFVQQVGAKWKKKYIFLSLLFFCLFLVLSIPLLGIKTDLEI